MSKWTRTVQTRAVQGSTVLFNARAPFSCGGPLRLSLCRVRMGKLLWSIS